MISLSDIFDALGWTQTIGDTIAQTLVSTGSAVVGVINACRELFITLLSIGTDLYNIIALLPLPASWLGIISISIFVIVALRIYSFIKDVEILGFKI